MSPHHPSPHARSSAAAGLDLGALDEGVLVAGHDLRVQRVNRAATDLLGWTDDAAGCDLRDTVWASLGRSEIAAVTTALAMGRRWDGAVDLDTASGATVRAHVSVSGGRGAGDLPDGVVVVVRPLPDGAEGEPVDGDEPLEGFCVAGLPGRFVLHHRPEVDVADGVVSACEAVLHWWHPGLGLVSPGGALRDAYGSDHLAAVEVWSVFAACRKAAAWAEADRPVRLSISLSGRRLADRDLLRRVRTALSSSGVPAPCVAVRMPGPAFSALPREAHRVVRSLAGEGIATIVDDVTGPLASAVLDPGAVAAVSLHPTITDWIETDTAQQAVADIVTRAHDAGATVTARGVRTEDQVDLARALGCDQVSGDVLSPPRSPAAVWNLLGRTLDAPLLAGPDAPSDEAAPLPAGTDVPTVAPVDATVGLAAPA